MKHKPPMNTEENQIHICVHPCPEPMPSITIRFSPELSFFLTRKERGQLLTFPTRDAPAVKHPIESLGIPHTEVGLILVNGRPAPLDARVQAGDGVEVYGHGDAPDVAQTMSLRPPPALPHSFVLDTHLGRLARYLRLLGFDALYSNDYADAELAAISAGQERILLTRDRGLLKHKIVDHGYCLRTTESRQQIVDVVRRFELAMHVAPYTRCLACNGALESVSKAAVLHLLEPKTKLYYHQFKRCPQCGRVFWKGSHAGRLDALVAACGR